MSPHQTRDSLRAVSIRPPRRHRYNRTPHEEGAAWLCAGGLQCSKPAAAQPIGDFCHVERSETSQIWFVNASKDGSQILRSARNDKHIVIEKIETSISSKCALQCRKCRMPVNIIAILRSLAAAITSSSRTE